MSNKVKDFLLGALFVIVLSVIMGGCLYHATSPEVWYAGEHTEGRDGTDNCGCYEKLIQKDKERNSK